MQYGRNIGGPCWQSLKQHAKSAAGWRSNVGWPHRASRLTEQYGKLKCTKSGATAPVWGTLQGGKKTLSSAHGGTAAQLRPATNSNCVRAEAGCLLPCLPPRS